MLLHSAQPLMPSSSLREVTADRTDRRLAVWSWLGLVVLLVANVPLMISMPLTADPVTYDLQAQIALEGGVLYRDLVEPNLPGVVWVHMAVRPVFGWSSDALRLFDLLAFAGIVVLLMRMVRRANSTSDFRIQMPTLALLLCWFYFSMSEWCHCQLDIWLMLPALGALNLRIRQLRQFSLREVGWKKLLLWGGLEGILWGMAFWIKPFVAVPALGSLIASAWLMKNWRASILNFSGVLLGGALCGLSGSIWLIQTGAWPHFWDMALNWNPEYFEAGRERWTFERYASMFKRFLPWSLIHCVAILVAVRNLSWMPRVQIVHHARTATCLLSVAYLGWLIQAHALQHLLDYVHVPGTLLGLSLIAASWPLRRPYLPMANLALASLLFVALISSPATRPQRLAWWARCLTEGSTPDVRSGLQRTPLPNWQELQPVLDFLKAQDLKDHNLTAYNVFLIHLYPELGLKPSTRYVFLNVHMSIFKDRAALIEKALNDSPQQFVVSSLLENGMHFEDIGSFSADQRPQLPANFPSEELDYFPYNQTLVFRSGQYVVHQVTQPVGKLNPNFFPLDRSTCSDNAVVPCQSSTDSARNVEAVSLKQEARVLAILKGRRFTAVTASLQPQ